MTSSFSQKYTEGGGVVLNFQCPNCTKTTEPQMTAHCFLADNWLCITGPFQYSQHNSSKQTADGGGGTQRVQTGEPDDSVHTTLTGHVPYMLEPQLPSL